MPFYLAYKFFTPDLMFRGCFSAFWECLGKEGMFQCSQWAALEMAYSWGSALISAQLVN